MITFIKRLIFGTNPNDFNAQFTKCESKMEERFLLAAWPVLRQYGRVVTQHPLGSYRLDVALPERKICIEVDGRDYHIKPEQVDNDKRRDRVLMRSGWITIRYPGREIYADADACAREVEAIILRKG